MSERVTSRRQRYGLSRTDDRRSASERGYGHRWAQLAKRHKEHYPACVECLKEDIVTPVAVTDHIKPITGPNDPGLYDWDNLQSLCRRHHAIKTHGETLT